MFTIKQRRTTMNYIMLNDRKIDLTDEQVKEIKKSFDLGKVKLSEIKVGETFKVEDHEFIVLEQSGDTTAVILKDLLYVGKEFGKNNNYDGSNVDKLCNDFAAKISKIIGKKNLIEHTVDLTSDDGLKDYGKIKRSASLLTCELYRKFVYILDKYKIDKWWWLATPFSTPTHEDSSWIKCVSPIGYLYYSYYYGGIIGVRPFCIFSSSISVSYKD